MENNNIDTEDMELEDVYTEINEEFIVLIQEKNTLLATQLYYDCPDIIDLHFDDNFVFEFACFNNDFV